MAILSRTLALLERTLVAPVQGASDLPPEPQTLGGPEQIAIYVHIPFCGSSCPYCVFNRDRSHDKMKRYVAALCEEIAFYGRQPHPAKTPVAALFFGGGTPSFIPAELIAQITAALRRHFVLTPDTQITLEGNPESIADHEKLRCYRATGINRISIGAQSFGERFLRRIGRRHSPRQIEAAIAQVRAAGFREISVDLMFGLPGQSLEDFAAELARAVATEITHLSLFAMLYRRGTPLWKHRVTGRPLWRMYQHGVAALTAAGFAQYTAEDFTRSGTCCRYQVEAWKPEVKGFLGFGAGAMSTYGDAGWYNVGDVDVYTATASQGRAPVAAGGVRGQKQRMLEHLLSAIKTLRLDPAAFKKRFDVALPTVVGPLPRLLRLAGLAKRDQDGSLQITTRGAYYAMLIWGDLVLRQLQEAGASSALAVTAPVPAPAARRTA